MNHRREPRFWKGRNGRIGRRVSRRRTPVATFESLESRQLLSASGGSSAGAPSRAVCLGSYCREPVPFVGQWQFGRVDGNGDVPIGPSAAGEPVGGNDPNVPVGSRRLTFPDTPLSGTLVASETVQDAITDANQLNIATAVLDAGQILSLTLQPSGGLQVEVTLWAPDGSPVATSVSPSADAPILLQHLAIAQPGEYQLSVASQAGTTGEYRLDVSLGAVWESEPLTGVANDLASGAEDLQPSFVQLDGVARAAVLGSATTGGVDVSDWYQIQLEDGQSLSLAVALTAGEADATKLRLYDVHETLLATSEAAFNTLQSINNFVDRTDDGAAETYFVQVVNPPTAYLLQAVRDGDFDREFNNLPPLAQDLGPSGRSLGFVSDRFSSTPVLVNRFEGQSFTSFVPPDPIVAAGPTHLVTMVNSLISIVDKVNGDVLLELPLSGPDGFFAAVGSTSTIFDPWIVYDVRSGRFFAMGIDIASSTQSNVYLAVSTTSAPTSAEDWHKYRLDFSHDPEPLGLGQGIHFPDYPKLAVSDDAVFISGNYFAIQGGNGVYAGITALDKASLLDGAIATKLYEEYFAGFSVFPLQSHPGTSTQYFAESVPEKSEIRLHAVTDVTVAPMRTVFDLDVPAFAEPVDVPQKGSPSKADTIGTRVSTGVWRDGSAWFAQAITEPGGDGETLVRWYEVATNAFPVADPILVQSGNVDPGPDRYAWMPAVAVDGEGNLGIGVSVGGSNEFFGAAFTGRLVDDPPGITALPLVTLAEGVGTYELNDTFGRNRWGDYSGLVVDPIDDRTFWVYNEFADAQNRWDTAIGAFQIDPVPDTDYYRFLAQAGDTLDLTTATPLDGPNLPVNALDPALELYDVTGSLVATDDNSADDGKNARLLHTVVNGGEFLARVRPNVAGGTYTLSVQGATGGDIAPRVVGRFPEDGQLVTEFPDHIIITLSEPALVASVLPSALTLNGIPAEDVIVDGANLLFQPASSSLVGDGTYTFSFDPTGIVDLQGGALAGPIVATFTLDSIGPRIVSTLWNGEPIPVDHLFTPGSLEIQAALSEDLFLLVSGRRGTLTPGVDDVILTNIGQDEDIAEESVVYSPETDLLSIRYADLPEGNYRLEIVSGIGALQDKAGNPLDGEPFAGAADGTPTGDGQPGGSYLLEFQMDREFVDFQPFVAVPPQGSLIRQSVGNRGYLNGPTDVDTMRFFLHADENVAARLQLDEATTAALRLIGPDGVTVVQADSLPDASLVNLPNRRVARSGWYNLEVTGDAPTSFTLDVVRNAVSETTSGDSEPGASLSLDPSFVPLGSGRFSVSGRSERRFEFLHRNDPTSFIDIAQTGTRLNLTDDSEETIVTQVGNDVFPAGTITVGNNGGVLQGPNREVFFQNLPLPFPTLGRGLFPFWDDLDDSLGGVYFAEQTVGGQERLIIQWDDMPHFDVGGDATFQLQVFEDGPIAVRFAYADVIFGDPQFDGGANATIGMQESDESGLLFSFNTPSISNGDVLDLLRTVDVDEYSVDLSSFVGRPVDVILQGTPDAGEPGFANAQLELLGPSGNLLATGRAAPLGTRPANFDLGLLDFVVPTAGRYTIRLTSGSSGDYGIVVGADVLFDTEPNSANGDRLRSFRPSHAALGYLSEGDVSDRWQVALSAGETLVVVADTLLNDPQATPQNDLGLQLEVLSDDGVTVLASDGGAPDRSSRQVQYTTVGDRTLLVAVNRSSGEGAYWVSAEVGEMDFGDAPSPISSLRQDNGPRHLALGPRLGTLRDTEPDGQPSPNADGDDSAGAGDDEDGVTLPVVVLGQKGVSYQVEATSVDVPTWLNAWIDFNGDGAFSVREQIALDAAVIEGANELTFDVPADVTAVGEQAARFRLSSQTGLGPKGLAPDGEIEDHLLTILPAPVLSIQDVQMPEGRVGRTLFPFVVTRSHNLNEVRVTVATRSGSAVADDDFVGKTQRFIFPTGGPLEMTFEVEVFGDRVAEPDEQFFVDLLDVSGAAVEVGSATGLIVNDDNGPRVASIRAAGSLWLEPFLQVIDPEQRQGYPIPGGSEQLAALPWTGVDRLLVEFNRPVQGLDLTSVSLIGVNLPDYQADIQEIAVDGRQATIQLSRPIPSDKLLLTITDAVTDVNGNRLDGDWVNAADQFPSGNGVSGGDFRFRLNVMHGDVNQSGGTAINDIGPFLAALPRLSDEEGYNPFADFNGSGGVAINDIGPLVANLAIFLPDEEPGASPAVAAAIDAIFAESLTAEGERRETFPGGSVGEEMIEVRPRLS